MDSLTTPVQQVWENPDGTRTAEISASPVRVNKAGKWLPIDTTLVTGPDGLLRPAATLEDVAISGGGATPLVTLRSHSTTMALSWPASLPTPSVDGNVATYADVAPGVDLRVTATADGVSEVLVVKTAAASHSAVVRSLTLGTSVAGGALTSNGVGGFDLRDAAGALVFRNGSATMWDTAALNASEKSQLAAEQPITGTLAEGAAAADAVRAHPQQSHRGTVGVQLTTTSVTLTPDTSLLDDSTTQYPVVIDPSLSPSTASSWGMVNSAYPTTTYYKWSTTDEGVGYSDFQSPVMTKRLYYAFATSALAGTHIISAQFSATETWSSGCVAREIDLWRTGNLASTTSWNTMPGWTTKVTSATVAHGNPSCATSGTTITPTDYAVEFNALSAVSTIASSKLSSATFGLRAASETDDLAWKRFKADGKLTVTYDHFPNTPTSLNLVTTAGAAVGCGTSTTPVPINSSSFYARGNFTDPDTGDQLTATFKYWSVATGTLISTRNIGPQAQGTIQTAIWGGMNTATYGLVYRWQAYSTDPSGQTSPIAPSASTYCYLKIDTSAPNPPNVTANINGVDTAPSSTGPVSNIAAGTALTFTFKPGGSVTTDTFRYRWSVNSDAPGPEYLPATATAGAVVTKSITLKSAGPTTVRVWAYDQAGNQSAPLDFDFVTTGSTPARWALDETTSPSSYDTSCKPTGFGPIASAMSWGAGVVSAASRYGNGLSLTSGSAATATASPLSAQDAQQNPAATATAWVHIDPAALSASSFVNRTFFSVDGPSGSALTVGIGLDSTQTPRLMAQLSNTGSTAPTQVFDTNELSTDYWYEVAASVDYETGLIQLFVYVADDFGVNSPTGGISTSWDPSKVTPVQLTGVQRVGAAKTSAGALTGQWLGQVDEVRTFRAAFTADNGLAANTLDQWMTDYPTQGAPLC
ncbi:hypothetical protein RKE38_10470 [Phycicoccus sp. M110.8]|uniref:hypothetical protein n=1 Tax=Phycicoccus sp. M110.8 TaxID=3075433 RepID=UPI0028FD3FDA|nr:hypothetical protein [Phycicoccus sp. M110.8]MDU0314109.1 hypothetical protein [Phycicoccus sp. M110.8]